MGPTFSEGDSVRILVTGARGLIGTELCKFLKDVSEFEVIEDEIADGNLFERKLPDIDLIIHLAANCIIREVIKHPSLAMENAIMAFEVLEYARQKKIPNIILFSSSRAQHSEENPYTASERNILREFAGVSRLTCHR